MPLPENHPAHQLPKSLQALFAWAGRDETAGSDAWESAITHQCGHLLGVADFTVWAESLWGLYTNHPFELVSFAMNGGAGLQYGWAVLAEELGERDFPCVAWAPSDDAATWLGDDTQQALETLMVGAVRSWAHFGREGESPDSEPEWADLCACVGLSPDLSDLTIGAGARVPRKVRAMRPLVPTGYHYVETSDGLGVLAPDSLFGGTRVHVNSAWFEDDHIAHARRHLDEGNAAAALVVLKATRYENPHYAPTVIAMRDVYRQLSRPLMVAQTEVWLAEHG
jgi:hypothetical protein